MNHASSVHTSVTKEADQIIKWNFAYTLLNVFSFLVVVWAIYGSYKSHVRFIWKLTDAQLLSQRRRQERTPKIELRFYR